MSTESRKTAPVGVFDSGVGGLTVAREISRQLPDENIVYFGDTARVPYGSKSQNTIIRFSEQIIRFLKTKQVKAIVIACNTASALALDKTHTQNISTGVFIFTKEEPQRVMAYILTDLVRGVTYWEARGGYTNQETNIIFTVVSKHELSALKHKLRQVDPSAFLVSKENVAVEGKFEKHLS